jgi:RNA polymerase sigma-70 factor (ECF subfamily)
VHERAAASALTPEDIKRALAGDRALVRRLVDELTPILQARVARALVRRGRASDRDVRQEVEDLTQDVFRALFSSGGKALLAWDPERGTLPTFIRWVADREVITILRVARKNPWTEEPVAGGDFDDMPAPENDPEGTTQSREILRSIITRVRETTSDLGRAVFDMLVLDGRSPEDVCAAMDMSPEAVYAWRSRLGRLARQIRAELQSETPPGRHR